MSPRTIEQNAEIRKQRKAAILQAAMQVFAEFGYTASSIAQIAKAAGVSKGLVYNYFESKEDLLVSMFEMMRNSTDDVWKPLETVSPEDQLRQLLEASFQFIAHNQQLSRLITQLSLQKDVIGNLSQQIETLLAEKLAMIEALLKEIGIDDAAEEALFLGAIMDGISLGALVLGNDYPLDEMKKRVYKRYML